MNQLDSASLYTDFNGLAELRRGAKENDPDAIKVVAQQFEAIFVQMMMKGMRDAKLADGLFDSDQTDQYIDMHDKQLANTLSSEGRGIGLADVIARQLGGASQQEEYSVESITSNIPARLSTQFMPGEVGAGNRPIADKGVAANAEVSSRGIEINRASRQKSELTGEPFEPVINTPDDFVTHLWPMAEKAAASLGVDPKAILAQAALETGWGRSILSSSDGGNSHNLFNIKSGSGWEGDSVVKSSLEFYDGVARQERSAFRSYDSYEDSFNDYVDFLQSNPRYEMALKEGGSAGDYLRGLQQAGYATDPKYAEKIESIMGRSQFVSSISSIEKPGAGNS